MVAATSDLFEVMFKGPKVQGAMNSSFAIVLLLASLVCVQAEDKAPAMSNPASQLGKIMTKRNLMPVPKHGVLRGLVTQVRRTLRPFRDETPDDSAQLVAESLGHVADFLLEHFPSVRSLQLPMEVVAKEVLGTVVADTSLQKEVVKFLKHRNQWRSALHSFQEALGVPLPPAPAVAHPVAAAETGARPHGPQVDLRCLTITHEGAEQWCRWDRVVRESVETSGDKWTTHLRGGPTAREALAAYRAHNGPVGHHREWVMSSGVDAKLPHVHEHFVLMMVLEFLGCYDQLNLTGLLGIEVLCRRAQLIESAFKLSADGGKTPDLVHAEERMGLHLEATGIYVSPTLQRNCADRLCDLAEVAKEVRKTKAANNTVCKRRAAAGGVQP